MVHRLILVMALMAGATPAWAFDGERSGFMLGGGVGPALSFIGQDIDGIPLDEFVEPGAALDLRAGWGVSEAIFLYASARGTWIRYDNQAQLDGDATHGVLGVGMTQFFAKGRSPWYSTAHLGLAWFDLLGESGANALFGFGFGAGLGYEWRDWIGLECVLGWETTSVDVGAAEFATSITTVRLQVVGMAY